jgi:uncharacterized Zn finger protein
MSEPFGLERDGQDDDGAAELTEAAWVSCPHCGEEVEVLVDAGGGPAQEYVEDCEVCCRPWQVRVAIGRDGAPTVTLSTLDEG